MATPAFPNPAQLLSAPAQALASIERGLPLGPPPISIGQQLLSIAGSIPATPGLPGAAGGAAGGLPFPALGGPSPLGSPTTVLASLLPAASAPRPGRPASPLPLLTPYGRTGIS